MSNEQTNPMLKRILIAVIGATILGAGLLVLYANRPPNELPVMRELRARGFSAYHNWIGANVHSDGLDITPDDCRLICRLPRLIHLYFEGGDMSGLNLDEIGNCRNLRLFSCSDVTQFPADEIGKLAACRLISRIHLTNAGLKDSDLEKLAGLTKLAHLDLSINVGITDAGLEHLAKIDSLGLLYLWGTNVTNEGIEEFRKKRPGVKVYFSDPLTLAAAAKENDVASELRARGFKVNRGTRDDLGRIRPSTVGSDGLNITADDCRLICQLSGLTIWAIGGGDMSGLNLDEIGNCTELEYFLCGKVTQFPVDEIKKLAACPLKSISLENIGLNDSDLEKFAGLTEIENIHFRNNAGITDAGFEYLEKIASLKHLSLKGTSVTEEGIEEFRKKRPDVTFNMK